MNSAKYVALLRGINVGGRHKVPMAALRQTLENEGFAHVKTLLNSGNVIFEAKERDAASRLEQRLSEVLAAAFGFPIPTLVRTSDDIRQIMSSGVFTSVEVHKDIRLYVTFLKEEPVSIPDLPWKSEDGSFTILRLDSGAVYSVLNVSEMKTVDAMAALERFFGKNITTRNWNTIVKIAGML